MAPRFVWDARKAASNLRKHWVSFAEAATCFNDTLSITIPDPDHSADEQRFVLLGVSDRHRLLVVAHIEQGDEIRLINARIAGRRERRDYEEGT